MVDHVSFRKGERMRTMKKQNGQISWFLAGMVAASLIFVGVNMYILPAADQDEQNERGAPAVPAMDRDQWYHDELVPCDDDASGEFDTDDVLVPCGDLEEFDEDQTSKPEGALDPDATARPDHNTSSVQTANPDDITGHPGIAVLTGLDPDTGLPASITFSGHLFDEGTVQALARADQSVTDHHRQISPGFLEPVSGD